MSKMKMVCIPHIENYCTGVCSEFSEVRTLHAPHALSLEPVDNLNI